MSTLQNLKISSAKRSESAFNVKVTDWDLPRWGNALAGEAGELCNIVKKLDLYGEDKFDRDGITPLKEALELEAGDIVIYLDLLCQRAGIDLESCIIKSFNKKSMEKNSDIFL